jgi:hypothetical protein
MEKTIREATEEVLSQELGKHKEAIRAQLITLLSKKNGPMIKQLVDGMISGVVKSDGLKYRINVSFDKEG